MPKKNPVRQFLKRVKELCDVADSVTDNHWDADKKTYSHINPDDGVNYWPFGFKNECLEKDCFKRNDGLWQQKQKINTHMRDGGSTIVFIWRIAPNYCIDGQPCYSGEKQQRLYMDSETEKVLYETENYEFVWTWLKWGAPTRSTWGLSATDFYFQVRDKKTHVVNLQEKTKAAFLRRYNALVKIGKITPD